MASQKPTGARRLGGSVRTAWFIVLVMMLAAAAWSISGKLTSWGMDWRLALGLSLMFDLSGLLCAEYARRAIERGTPAGLARLAIAGFVAVSGVLNWSHGREIGGTVGGIGLASISGAVELLFELHRRDVRDEQRSARGLVAERMPHIPLLGWLLFPRQSWRTLRAAVRVRLSTLDTVQAPAVPVVTVERTAPAAPAPAPALPAVEQPTLNKAREEITPEVKGAEQRPERPAIRYSDPRCAVIRPLYDSGYRPTTGEMAAALVAAGLPKPSPSILRGRLRDEIESYEPHLKDLLPRPTPLHRAG